MDSSGNEILDEKEKKPSSYGWLSVVFSVYFIVRSIMYFSKGQTGMGLLMGIVGAAGLIYKLYKMSNRKNN